MKKSSSATWSLGDISAPKWPNMRWCCLRATWSSTRMVCWTLVWSILWVNAGTTVWIWADMVPETSGASSPKTFTLHLRLFLCLCKHEDGRTYIILFVISIKWIYRTYQMRSKCAGLRRLTRVSVAAIVWCMLAIAHLNLQEHYGIWQQNVAAYLQVSTLPIWIAMWIALSDACSPRNRPAHDCISDIRIILIDWPPYPAPSSSGSVYCVMYTTISLLSHLRLTNQILGDSYMRLESNIMSRHGSWRHRGRRTFWGLCPWSIHMNSSASSTLTTIASSSNT